MNRVTAQDHLERHPALEGYTDRLRMADDPQLVARVTRRYWWAVEYLGWIDGRWYGCVQNYDGGEWETTDVAAYDDDQALGMLAKTEVDDHPHSLQFIPREESPL